MWNSPQCRADRVLQSSCEEINNAMTPDKTMSKLIMQTLVITAANYQEISISISISHFYWRNYSTQFIAKIHNDARKRWRLHDRTALSAPLLYNLHPTCDQAVWNTSYLACNTVNIPTDYSICPLSLNRVDITFWSSYWAFLINFSFPCRHHRSPFFILQNTKLW